VSSAFEMVFLRGRIRSFLRTLEFKLPTTIAPAPGSLDALGVVQGYEVRVRTSSLQDRSSSSTLATGRSTYVLRKGVIGLWLHA
jgi:hypothetical protein